MKSCSGFNQVGPDDEGEWVGEGVQMLYKPMEMLDVSHDAIIPASSGVDVV
jgi:hypothetical protein